MRYLLTGGAGFIGSHLADGLSARGDEVLVLDDLSTGRRQNIEHLLGAGGVQFVEGSVTDADLVEGCMREVDVCLHLASAVGVRLVLSESLETLLDHVRGTDVVMAAAARHGRRLLFTSTSEVYGKRSAPALGEGADLVLGSPAMARWSYAIAKCFGEALAHGYHARDGAQTIVVRLFNTVGPRQSGAHGMVFPRLVRQALDGEDLTVYGDGTQMRCFVHVLDTVRAILALSDEPRAAGNTYNIGSPTPVTIGALARRVIARSGSSSQVTLVPYAQAYPSGFEELGDREPDIAALRELTGWAPARTLDDAIDDVIRDHRAARAAVAGGEALRGG